MHTIQLAGKMERGSTMTEQKKVYTLDWAGRQLIVETGQYAKQANGAVLIRYGDSTVLSYREHEPIRVLLGNFASANTIATDAVTLRYRIRPPRQHQHFAILLARRNVRRLYTEIRQHTARHVARNRDDVENRASRSQMARRLSSESRNIRV